MFGRAACMRRLTANIVLPFAIPPAHQHLPTPADRFRHDTLSVFSIGSDVCESERTSSHLERLDMWVEVHHLAKRCIFAQAGSLRGARVESTEERSDIAGSRCVRRVMQGAVRTCCAGIERASRRIGLYRQGRWVACDQ